VVTNTYYGKLVLSKINHNVFEQVTSAYDAPKNLKGHQIGWKRAPNMEDASPGLEGAHTPRTGQGTELSPRLYAESDNPNHYGFLPYLDDDEECVPCRNRASLRVRTRQSCAGVNRQG